MFGCMSRAPQRLLFILLVLQLAFEARADLLLGTGFNSATGGRLVPALNLGAGSNSFEVLFSSTGVSTQAYYHSAYKLGAYWTWKAGDFFIGSVEAGLGPGALYAERSFQDTGVSPETKNDYVLGPTFFVRWVIFDPVFLAVEGLYGLIGPSNRYGDIVALNARDSVSLIIGLRR